MAEQTLETRKYGFMTKISALSVALLMYLTSMTTPALALIQAGLPDATPEQIALISSIPSLMMIFFSLVGGWMTNFLSIKKTILIGAALSLVGVLPSFFGGIEFIIFTRVVFGAGYGIIFVMASAVVVDLFTGDMKNKMMGWKSAAGSVAGIVFQMLGGALAAINWRYAFLGFFLTIPIVLLILFFLPDTGVKKKAELPEELKSVNFFHRFGAKTWSISVIGFLHNVLQFSFMVNMASYMVADGIGGEGAAMAAASVLSTFTAASFAASLVYGYIAKATKRFTPALGALLVGIGFIICLTGQTTALFFVSAVVFGIGFAMTNASYTTIAADGAKHKQFSPMAISLYVCFVGLGQFSSAYILKWMQGILQINSTRPYWVMAAVGMTVGSVVALVLLLFKKDKKAA